MSKQFKQLFLTPEDIQRSRIVFEKYDIDKNGTIEAWELKKALQSIGHDVTDEELFSVIAKYDTNGNGRIEFQEFLMIVENQKSQIETFTPDNETLEAFVALGGNEDKTGQVSLDKLKELVEELGLTLSIDTIMKEVDKDGSGFIDFDEFALMLRGE